MREVVADADLAAGGALTNGPLRENVFASDESQLHSPEHNELPREVREDQRSKRVPNQILRQDNQTNQGNGEQDSPNAECPNHTFARGLPVFHPPPEHAEYQAVSEQNSHSDRYDEQDVLHQSPPVGSKCILSVGWLSPHIIISARELPEKWTIAQYAVHVANWHKPDADKDAPEI